MADRDVRVRMTPSHPGDFMRREIIEELGLNVTKAAETRAPEIAVEPYRRA